MKFRSVTESARDVKAELVAVSVPGKGALSFGGQGQCAKLDKHLDGLVKSTAAVERFEGKPGQRMKVCWKDGTSVRWYLFVGVGAARGAQEAHLLGVLTGRVAHGYASVALFPSTNPSAQEVSELARGFCEGMYRYTQYLTDKGPKARVKQILIGVKSASVEIKAAMNRGEALGKAVCYARDLVNAPPNDLYPETLAENAKDMAKGVGLKCAVWDKKRIERQGFRLMLAVNRGSAKEPRVIHLTHKPAKAKQRVVFVGKGLTFDAGGLCIKPAKSMVDMKCDMAGAATTLGVAFAAAALDLPVEVHALVGSTENMTGADAYRPGDVFTSYSGKTVEIINTDAEGRLVLADVLAYATELNPDVLIDHATLTGACMVALGKWTAGLFANDRKLAAQYSKAAREVGEDFWELPLDDDQLPVLDSDIADIKHCGDGWGGAITAALFLREFVGKSKWIHCDIAGPAFLDRPKGALPSGGTGFGVATAIRFLEGL